MMMIYVWHFYWYFLCLTLFVNIELKKNAKPRFDHAFDNIHKQT